MNFESSNPNTNTARQSSRSPKTIQFNKAYVFSFNGILRALLILIQFSGSISAASIPKLVAGEFYLIGELDHIRNAFLFFSIMGLLIASLVYTLFVLDLISYWPSLNKLPWKIIILASDVIWMLAMLIVSIFCACQEANYNEYPNYFLFYVNEGAFGAASFFGFISMVLYGIDAFLTSKLSRDLSETNN